MKHSTRLAALMTAAAIIAFLPSAQVCGQSRRGGGAGHSPSSSSYSHGASSSGHSRSGSFSAGSQTHSRPSGGSSSISQHHSRPGGGSSSVSQHHSRPGGGSSSVSQHHSRPGGGSISGSQTHSRPSGGSSSISQHHSRPSGGSMSGSQTHSRPGSGSVSGGQQRPRSGGYNDGVYSGSRRSGGSTTGASGHRSHSDIRDHGAVVPQNHSGHPAAGSHSADGASRPEGRGHIDGSHRSEGHYADGARRPGSHSGSVTRHERPRPGSRPYADGAYGRQHSHALPSRVHVSNHPGARPAHHRPPVQLRERPYGFHHHGHHYYGHYVPAPPRGYVVRHYWGRDYYYYNDIWYRYHSGRYWVCRPPWGYVFTPLADAVYTACTFAYYYDRIHYYDTINENASTIVAQNATIAANNAVIASQNETIARNAELAQATGDLANSLGLVQSFADASTEYFYNDGVFYIKSADGQYTVIVPPAGALVESLPDDYEIIELDGESYYKVDDTIYRTTVVDGKAMFEVLGQMVK